MRKPVSTVCAACCSSCCCNFYLGFIRPKSLFVFKFYSFFYSKKMVHEKKKKKNPNSNADLKK
jgi:hypothetical protein